MKKIIFLMGPTAAGKTDFSLELASALPVEIMSVDSAMVYRGMDIGTGKPTRSERFKVDHHLIDIREPSEIYSAAEFVKDAKKLIPEIIARGKIPLLVGGTMLYFKALMDGLSELPSADPDIRASLLQKANALGWNHLHQELSTIDAIAAERIHPNDAQRIQRALEVYLITGRPISSYQRISSGSQDQKNAFKASFLSDYETHPFALIPEPRSLLHERIHQRFLTMLEMGFIEEVKQLMERGDLTLELPSMRSVGYRQVWRYLENQYDYTEMKERVLAATRQLAKRQLTWLRSLNEVKTLENNHLASFKYVVHCVS